MRLENLAQDHRKKEWIQFLSKEGAIYIGKVVRKSNKQLLLEHWQVQENTHLNKEEFSRCNGCDINTLNTLNCRCYIGNQRY
jgi:exosome complex RNA-binding protein Csl4